MNSDKQPTDPARAPRPVSPSAPPADSAPPAAPAGTGPPAPAPSPERIGHYELLRRLGRGAMGEVHVARDTKLQRLVALKRLAPAAGWEDEARVRFEREARAIAALRHPNVVTIFTVEEDRGTPFLTMELIEGESLARRVRPGGLDLREFVELALPLAEAVGAAHSMGITHRDLKPDNVLIGKDGILKVLDFGLARFSGPDRARSDAAADADAETQAGAERPLTEQGRVMGTLAYMSPEQASGAEVDPRSDLFSLGVLYHELLAGCRPFQGNSQATVLAAILRDEPEDLATLRPELPAELTELVTRCLAKEAADRPANGEALAAELRALRDAHLSTAQADVGSAPGLPARLRRRPRIVAATLALSALGALALGLVAQRGADRRGEAAAVAQRSRVLVEPVRSGAEPEWAAALVRHAVASALAEHPGFRLVERAPGSATSTGEGPAPAHDARLEVGVSPREAGGLHLRATLVSSYSAERSVQESAELDEAAQLTGALPALVSRTVRAGGFAAAEELGTAVRRELPARPAAHEPYGRGLAALRAGQPQLAVAALTEARVHEPLHAPLTVAALRALSAAGDRAGALELAQSLELGSAAGREGLPEALKAEVAEATGDWRRAAEHRARLLRADPDDPARAMLLLRAQVEAGDVAATAGTLSAQPDLRLKLGATPALLLIESRAARLLGEPTRQRELAEASALAARRAGDGRARGEALLLEADARARLGDLPGAALVLEQARRVHGERGDDAGVTRALLALAEVLEREGRHAEARSRLEAAPETGDALAAARRHARAGLAARLGRPGAADLLDAEALALARSAGDGDVAARSLRGQALRAWEWGAHELAEQHLAAALGADGLEPSPGGTSRTFLLWSALLEERDRLDEAFLAARAAVAHAGRASDRHPLPAALRRSASLRERFADAEGARADLVAAIVEADRAAGRAEQGVRSRWALAALENRDGTPDDARARLLEAARHAAGFELPALEAASHGLLARLALESGDHDAAARASEQQDRAARAAPPLEALGLLLSAGLEAGEADRQRVARLPPERRVAQLARRSEEALLAGELPVAARLLDEALPHARAAASWSPSERAALELRAAALRRATGRGDAAVAALRALLADEESLDAVLAARAAAAWLGTVEPGSETARAAWARARERPSDEVARAELEVATLPVQLAPVGALSLPEVLSGLESAALDFAARGELARAAWSRRRAATLLAERDHPGEAAALQAQVAEVDSDLGNRRMQALDLARQGLFESRALRDQEASRTFQAALALAAESDWLIRARVARMVLERGEVFALSSAQRSACAELNAVGAESGGRAPWADADGRLRSCDAAFPAAGGLATAALTEAGSATR